MRQILHGLLPFIVACTMGDAEPNETEAGGTAALAATAEAPGPTGNAAIVGTVRLTGNAPSNPAIDMSATPVCLAIYSGGKPTDFIVDGRAGALANVFVYVKGGLPEPHRYPPPSKPATISQDECRLKPRVVGVMIGQPLEILNSDSVNLAVTAAPDQNEGFTLELPSDGDAAQRTFLSPEVMVPLQSSERDWVRAYVGVVDHPFFAVTDGDGAFRIEGLPPGTYELEAWHETLGTRTLTVRVPADQAVTTQFTFAQTAP